MKSWWDKEMRNGMKSFLSRHSGRPSSSPSEFHLVNSIWWICHSSFLAGIAISRLAKIILHRHLRNHHCQKRAGWKKAIIGVNLRKNESANPTLSQQQQYSRRDNRPGRARSAVWVRDREMSDYPSWQPTLAWLVPTLTASIVNIEQDAHQPMV